MKAPNPTFLDRAENIRNKRRLVTLILIAVLAVTVLIVVFVMSVASYQNEYAMLYPDMVGRATDTTTTLITTTEITTTTTETTESSEETTTETTKLAPSLHTETTPEETTSESTKATDSSPEKLDIEDFHFSSPNTQIASHQTRAVLLDHMKNDIENYIKTIRNSRISFRYVSLKNGEELGINELDPIVPAGTYALPVSIVTNGMAITGEIDPAKVITYEGHANVSGSYITSKYQEGKQIYLGYLEHLMVASNDNVAYEMLLKELGGLEAVVPKINEISSYQSYDKDVFYTNYAGKDYKGKGRSTCYDMSNYMRFLYRSYASNPSGYQSIINALANSTVESPISSAFKEGTPILHIYGRNKELHAYTELAIIEMKEPVAVCISIECEDEGKVSKAFADIAKYLSDYITALY